MLYIYVFYSVPSMYDYWENVTGVSMTRLGSLLREQVFKKPLTEILDPQTILSEPEVVIWFDLREVTLDDVKDIQVQHVAVTNEGGRYQGKGHQKLISSVIVGVKMISKS